jgi:hypothetical protein
LTIEADHVRHRLQAEAELGTRFVAGHHRRVGRARRDGDDVDALPAQLAAQRLAEAGESAFCGGIAGVERHPHLRDAGGDVDDQAVAGRA